MRPSMGGAGQGTPPAQREGVAGGGSVGDAYDNTMAESFFSTLEAGLLKRRRFTSQAEAQTACFSSIEGWYNPLRRHSGLGYRSPVADEAEGEGAMNEP